MIDMRKTIITHSDSDGIISASLILKYLNPEYNHYIYFASPNSLRDVICYSVLKKKLSEVYILDLSANRESLIASSIYPRAIWIDHHVWNLDLGGKIPENVTIVIDENAESTAKVISKYLGIDCNLVEIANQIDRNNVESQEAEFFRNLIGGIRAFYKDVMAEKLRKLVFDLATKDFREIMENEENKKIVEDYQNLLKGLDNEIEKNLKIFEINNKRIAIYQSINDFPVYYLTNKLKNHEKAPFNYIIVMMYKKFGNKLVTKIEFRTHTNENVLDIAKYLGGGGHRVASGATIEGYITHEQLIEKIRNFL